MDSYPHSRLPNRTVGQAHKEVRYRYKPSPLPRTNGVEPLSGKRKRRSEKETKGTIAHVLWVAAKLGLPTAPRIKNKYTSQVLIFKVSPDFFSNTELCNRCLL